MKNTIHKTVRLMLRFVPFAAILLSFLVLPGSARAGFVNTPTAGAIVTNGPVYAITETATGTYVGGSFTQVGVNQGSFIPVETSTGNVVSSDFAFVGSDLNAVVSDGSGGWYVGGYVAQVGSTAKYYLAHINSDNSVDTNFNPVLNSFGHVYAMALSPDGSTLYVGGQFTTVDGVTYNRVAAINTSDGTAVSTFNPNFNGNVLALALSSDGSKLYVGGEFTKVGGVTYNKLAAINTASGTAITTFNPNVNGTVESLALSSDGSTLYVGGQFTTIGGVTYNRLAAVNTSNGTAVSAFNPNLNASVESLALSSDGSKLYFGGTFTTVGGVAHNRLAAVNTSNGTAVSAFNPSVDNQVQTLALSSDDSKLYVGGYFNNVNSTLRNYIAAVNSSDGTLVSGFNPNSSSVVRSLTLSDDDSTLYVAGFQNFLNGTNVSNLVRINSNGSLDTNFFPAIKGTVRAVAVSPDLSTVYAGGQFTTVGSATYNRLAGFSASNGAVVSAFNPNVNNTVNAVAVSPDGSKVYLGGLFTTVAGTSRSRLAAVNASNGSIVTSFNPSPNSTVNALTLSSDGSKLYVGGMFSLIGGVGYSRLAAVNTASGTPITTFNPGAGFTVNALALSSDGSTLYAGGAFTTIGTTTYNRLAAVNTASGTAITTFNPNLNSTVNSLALTADGSKLYVGGIFTTVGGVTYNRLAAVNTSNGGAISAFNPNVNNTVNALAVSSDGTKLFSGGTYLTVGGDWNYHHLSTFGASLSEM